jgi:hypothetical protein
MDGADEGALVAALRERISDLRLVCGGRWPTPDPPIVETIADCADHFVYLWSPTVVPDLPLIERAGRYDGPKSGVVIQFQRSVLTGTQLRAGRLAVGWSPASKAMTDFVNAAWAALRMVTTANVAVADGTPVRTHRIGFSAAAWSPTGQHASGLQRAGRVPRTAHVKALGQDWASAR